MSLLLTSLRRLRRAGFWHVALAAGVAVFVLSTAVRLSSSLGAVTHLNDRFPWGLWVGFKLSAIGLAGGGFTLMAVVHLLNLRRFEPIVRPAVLTALLGYLTFISALLLDLGQPWRIWHAMVFWNPRSVMFEVAWCVMLYTTVLSLEFAPIVFERFGLEAPRRVLHALTTPLVIAGFVLSTLHQSSLGSLYLIVPSKLHPLWYSPLIPLFFYLSAIAGGLGMVILQSYLSERAFGRRLDLNVVEPLARAMVVLLGVYGLLRLIVLRRNGELAGLLHPGYEGGLFLLELALGVVFPVVWLSSRRRRERTGGLAVGALATVLGLMLNRLNVAVTGMERAAGVSYLPSAVEIGVFVGLVALGFSLFVAAVRWLPVFPEREIPRKAAA